MCERVTFLLILIIIQIFVYNIFSGAGELIDKHESIFGKIRKDDGGRASC